MRKALAKLERRLAHLETGSVRMFVPIIPPPDDKPSCRYWTAARCQEAAKGLPRFAALVTCCPKVPEGERLTMGSAGIVDDEAAPRLPKPPPCQGCEYYRLPDEGD